MTELELRRKAVAALKGLEAVGSAEEQHGAVLRTYNAQDPLPVGYTLRWSDAWCAATMTATAILAGLTDIIPAECSCPRQIAAFQQMGRWEEDESITPEIGDLIYYDWQDSGAGDNRGTADHVGMVLDVSGRIITIMEGNKNGAIGIRQLTVNGRYIRGYGRPDYLGLAKSQTQQEEEEELTVEAFSELEAQRRAEVQALPGSSWSQEARDWATQTGLVQGSGSGFMWQDTLTREQLVTILFRFAQQMGKA